MVVVQRQARGKASAGAARPQRRAARRDGWSKDEMAQFVAVLAEGCNVTEAARAAGRCRQRAYERRRADPAFARAWDMALEQGYAEIELMLMRASLFGTESEETILDSVGAVKGRKVKRGVNLGVALRLFQLHRERVARIRAEEADRAGDGPDGADARRRVDAMLDDIRRQRALAADRISADADGSSHG